MRRAPTGRLLTSRVSRLHATYTFTARLFVRVIAQSTATTRDPRLFLATVSRKDGDFSGSALLAHKLNWQSVLFVGYGDDRELVGERSLTPSDRQLFVKMSYALPALEYQLPALFRPLPADSFRLLTR